jgi:hypothetical protein
LTREIELLRGEAIRLKQRAETAEVLTWSYFLTPKYELNKIDASAADVEKLKLDLNERNKAIGKLRNDGPSMIFYVISIVIQYQSHLSEALKRMNTDDSVDR